MFLFFLLLRGLLLLPSYKPLPLFFAGGNPLSLQTQVLSPFYLLHVPSYGKRELKIMFPYRMIKCFLDCILLIKWRLFRLDTPHNGSSTTKGFFLLPVVFFPFGKWRRDADCKSATFRSLRGREQQHFWLGRSHLALWLSQGLLLAI